MSYIICNIFFLSAVALLIDSRLRVGRLICWFNSCGVCHLPFQVKSSQVAFNKTMTIALHVQTRRIKKRQQKNTMSRETQKNSQLPTVNTHVWYAIWNNETWTDITKHSDEK